MTDNDSPKKREQDAAEGSTVEGRKAEREVEERLRLGALAIFEIVRREGAEELRRPASSLWWSGVAAGMALALSAAGAAMFTAALPDSAPTRLLVPIGYVIGFLIVIFGRLQLFTENTIAAVFPLAAAFSKDNWIRVGRLWAIVFAANIAGALGAAAVFNFTPMLEPGIFDALVRVSEHAVVQPWLTVFARAVPAGFLIAALVWMMPSAKGSEFLLISSVIYVLVLGGFTHVVVGATEAFTLLMDGHITLLKATVGFILPALLGNVVGGAALFAMLAYAQIRDEVRTGLRDEMI
jgi:formate-nitrite transporter family protein